MDRDRSERPARPGKRVLWISPKLPWPLVSGDRIRQYNLLRKLAVSHQIDLLAFAAPGEDPRPDELTSLCRRMEGLPLPARQPWPTRVASALHPRVPFYESRYESVPMRAAVAEAVRDRDYDVVQVEHVYMARYFESAAGSSARRVLTMHNIESHLARRCAAVERNPAKWAYWRLEAAKLERAERYWLRQVDTTITMSDEDRYRALALTPGATVRTVENGVDTEAYQAWPCEDRESLAVFTGSLAYPPNADGAEHLLADIWPRVRAAVPGVACAIVGRDPSPRLRARHGRDGVTVTGPVPDVRPYLARAGVFVAPLRAGGGTRLKILEAMASGCAVVTTTVGAEGLAVQHGRDLILADDPESFAQATVRVLQDLALRCRLGAAARQRAEERFDWRFAAAAHEVIYDRVTGNGPVRCES